jgi:regulatory protein
MKNQTTARDCFAAALRVLARRDHSCTELSGKLADRGFPREHIQWAVDRCLHFHYLDDERFAGAYIEHLRRKGYGCHRIRHMLVTKGVAHDIISTCLAPYCSDAVQFRDCHKAMAKKRPTGRWGKDAARAKAKLFRFLISRGFPPDIIRQVLDQGEEGI